MATPPLRLRFSCGGGGFVTNKKAPRAGEIARGAQRANTGEVVRNSSAQIETLLVRALAQAPLRERGTENLTVKLEQSPCQAEQFRRNNNLGNRCDRGWRDEICHLMTGANESCPGAKAAAFAYVRKWRRLSCSKLGLALFRR